MRILDILQTGSWLTTERLRRYPVIFLAALGAMAVALLATSHGSVDAFGRPLGTDFSGVWVAGKAVLAGHPARPFDRAAHAAAQAAAFGLPDFFLPWPYPPLLLAPAAVLATLPYPVALALWQAVTLILDLVATFLAVRGAPLRRHDVMLASLAFPAVALNALHGQNAFLSASLLSFGTLLLQRRPALAGICLGLLAFKPQLSLIWPAALLAGRHWRTTAAACLTVGASVAASLFAFGLEPWHAFLTILPWMRRVVLEDGGLPASKMVSAFAAVRLIGGSIAAAYAVQLVVAMVAIASCAFVWWRREDRRLALAALVTASLLASPYCVDYDLATLGPALAGLVALGLARGFAPFERSLLASVWAMPLAARPVAMAVHLPLGFLCLAALHGLVIWRAVVVPSRMMAARLPDLTTATP